MKINQSSELTVSQKESPKPGRCQPKHYLPTFKDVETTRAYLAFRFPKLANAPLVEARVCQYTNCPDGHYLIDRHPQASNVWIAGAGGGHAFKMGPALGTYLSDLILEEKQIEPFFSFRRLEEKREKKSQLFTGSNDQ